MNSETCRNCATSRFKIKARGLCKNCYSLSKKIKHIEGWDPQKESTLVEYPKSMPLLPPSEIARMKLDVLEQLKHLLKEQRSREERLKEPIGSMDIECQLKWLAEKVGARDAHRIMHGTAICFDSFTPDQRSTLFRLLYSIEENIPRRDRIHWTRYMNPPLHGR